MIRVICLNPVIDRFYFIEGFISGRLYRGNVPLIYAGGKGVNVARVISMLGEKCAIYGFLGSKNKDFFETDFEIYSIENKMLEYEGSARTTINVIDKENGKETEIIERSMAIDKKSIADLLNRIETDVNKNDIVVCSGIPIHGCEDGIYSHISMMCESKGAKCILDTNGSSFKSSFPGKYYMCKPNLREIRECMGIDQTNNISEMELARMLISKGAENVLISMGEKGGILADENSFAKAVVPKVKVISTIGSGDATVAGFTLGLFRGYDKLEQLRLAMACGVCNSMNNKVGYVDRDCVYNIGKKIIIEKSI